MTPARGKKIANAAGAELYWDALWRVWGLIDPSCSNNEESFWYSANQLRALSDEQYAADVEDIRRRRQRDA